MAVPVSTALQEIRGRYGLTYSTSEDNQFTNAHLMSLLNDAYRWLAGLSKTFFDDALEVSIEHGQRIVTLEERLIKPVTNTFRYQQSDDTANGWVPLTYRIHHSLIHDAKGAMENVAPGAPKYVTLLPSDGETTGRRLLVVPAPKLGASVTAKIRYAGYLFPPRLTNVDNDEIQLSPADCDRLYAAVNLRMALWEKARGRNDAPVAEFNLIARAEAEEMHRLEREATREPARSPETRESPLAEALEQMRPSGLGV